MEPRSEYGRAGTAVLRQPQIVELIDVAVRQRSNLGHLMAHEMLAVDVMKAQRMANLVRHDRDPHLRAQVLQKGIDQDAAVLGIILGTVDRTVERYCDDTQVIAGVSVFTEPDPHVHALP